MIRVEILFERGMVSWRKNHSKIEKEIKILKNFSIDWVPITSMSGRIVAWKYFHDKYLYIILNSKNNSYI